MRKRTGIILRLIVVLGILGLIVAAVAWIYFATTLNEYEHTSNGKEAFKKAEKLFEDAKTAAEEGRLQDAEAAEEEAWKELEMAKKSFEQAINVKAQYFPAYYGWGKCYMLEAENSLDDLEKSRDAFFQANEKFDKTMRYCPWHMAAAIQRCKIFDEYSHNPLVLSSLAKKTLQKVEARKKADPKYASEDPELKKERENQLRYYLAKGSLETAQRESQRLIPSSGGEDLSTQERMLAYARVAAAFQDAAKVYLNLAKEEKLPEELTLRQIHLSVGAIYLQMIDAIWQVYQGKVIPELDFEKMTPDKAKEAKEILVKIGVLEDPSSLQYKEDHKIRRDLGEKATRHFEQARKASDEETMEETVLAIGEARCLYGVSPMGRSVSELPGEKILRDAMEDDSITKTEEFYTRYAELLMRLNKVEEAGEVLKKGLERLDSPAMYLELGRYEKRNGRYEEAEKQLTIALDKDKNNEDMHYEIANLYLAMAGKGDKSKLAKAREHLQWLMNEDPENGNYLMLKGRIDMIGENFEEAWNTFQEVYKKGPQWKMWGAYFLSLICEARQDITGAEDWLNKAKDFGRVPNMDVYKGLVRLLTGRGELRKALAVCEEFEKRSGNLNIPVHPDILQIMANCQEAIDDKEGAAKTYGKLIRSGDNKYRMMLAYMLLRGITTNVEVEWARKTFRQVIDTEKALPAWEKTLGAYYGLARCEIARRGVDRYATAIRILEQEAYPLIQEIKAYSTGEASREEDFGNKYKTYLLELFNYYRERKPVDEEELNRIAKALHDTSPEDPRVFQHWLTAQTMGLSAEEAAAKEKQLVEQELEGKSNQKQNRIMLLYADTLARKNRLEEARQWYAKVEVPADDTENIGLSVNSRLAGIYISMEKLEDAKKYIDVLVEKYPDEMGTAMLLATYRALSAKDLNTRIVILKKEIEDHPDIPNLHKLLGDAYLETTREKAENPNVIDIYRSAMLEYNLVLEHGRRRPDIIQRLARVHIAIGRLLAGKREPGKAADEYAKARTYIKSLLETGGYNPFYLQLMADVDIFEGKMGDAKKLLTKAAEIREVEKQKAEEEGNSATLETCNAELELIYGRLIAIYDSEDDNIMSRAMNEKLAALATTTAQKLRVGVSSAIIAEKEGKNDEARMTLEKMLDDEEITGDQKLHMQLIRQISQFYMRRRAAATSEEERDEYLKLRGQILDKGIALYPDAAQMYIWKAGMYIMEGERAKALELINLAVENENAKEKKNRDVRIYTSAGLYCEQRARSKKELEKADLYMLEAARLDPENPVHMENLFNLYLRHTDLFGDKARNKVAELLKQDPKNARWLVISGRLTALAGDTDDAIKQFKKAIEIDPLLDTAYLQWADEIYEKSPDKIDEAIEIIEKGLKQSDKSTALKNTLGRFYMIKKDYAKARRQFMAVLASNKMNFTALDAIARISLEELSDPEVDYEKGLAETVSAVDDLYRFYPNTPATHRVLGFLELQQGNYNKAVKYFQQAYALGNDPVSLRMLSKLYLDRQAVALNAGELEAWARRLSGWQYDPALRMLVGRCMSKLGRDGADALFQDAAGLSPNDADMAELFSDIYYLDREYSSDRHFEKCLEIMEKNVDKAANFAKLYIEAGYPDRALELIERVSESIDPADRPKLDAMRAYIYLFEMSDEYEPESERVKKAEELARGVLDSDIDPKPAGALCVIGKIMCDKGGDEYEKGIEYIKSAIEAEPKFPSFYCALAETYHKRYMQHGERADMKGAIKAIDAVIRMDPYYYMLPALYLWRGDIYYAKGGRDDKVKAREDYRKYLELGGKERAEEIKNILKETE